MCLKAGQADCEPLVLLGSTRAYRSSWCSRPRAPAAPGWPECHSPLGVSAWQTSAEACDCSPAWESPPCGSWITPPRRTHRIRPPDAAAAGSGKLQSAALRILCVQYIKENARSQAFFEMGPKFSPEKRTCLCPAICLYSRNDVSIPLRGGRDGSSRRMGGFDPGGAQRAGP